MWLWIILGIIAAAIVFLGAAILFGVSRIDKMYRDLEELTHLDEDE